MSLIRDPSDCGFLRRLIHVYHEKRSTQPVLEYGFLDLRTPSNLRRVHRRMPRRAAWQIAWHQARAAAKIGA